MFKRVAIKIGSNVLAGHDGYLNIERIKSLVGQFLILRQQGIELVIISSGAVASGRSLIKIPEKVDPVSARQLLSSLGQVKLINVYADLFNAKNVLCSQVLVTKEDFRTRSHYLNMKNCLQVLLQHNIVPIVNENDVVSITELMFTDNDELAGLIATMLNADALIILTNVDGVYLGDPGKYGSEILRTVNPSDYDFSKIITSKKSNFGRGGMITKCNIAKKVAMSGIDVFIANGLKDGVIPDILNGKESGTHFLKGHKTTSTLKRWLAHSEGFAKGRVYVNEGAKKALYSSNATSLLPVGITRIEGEFKKGDILKILDENDLYIGLGISQYGYDKALERKGLQNQKPLIHYDYLYLT